MCHINNQITKNMKKVLSIAAVALFVSASLVSCKKEYTCECTTTYAGVSSTTSTTFTDTKANAKTRCETSSASSSIGYSTTCKIK